MVLRSNEDALVGKAAAKGASELAKSKGLELVFSETYPKGTVDFSGVLNQVIDLCVSNRHQDLAHVFFGYETTWKPRGA